MVKKKITIDSLAQMTQDEFARIDEKFDARFDKVDNDVAEIKSTLKTVLDVVLEIPSKKAFERLETKVQAIDVRLTSVERKVK